MEGQYFEYTMGFIPENNNINGEPAPASASPNAHPILSLSDEELDSLFLELEELSENNESVESSESVESNENFGSNENTDSQDSTDSYDNTESNEKLESNENTDSYDNTDSISFDQLDALFEEIEETDLHSAEHVDQAEPNNGATHAPTSDSSSKESENAPQHTEQVEPNEHIASNEHITSNEDIPSGTNVTSNDHIESPILPADEETLKLIKGLGDDDWFPNSQFNWTSDDALADGSSADQNRATAGYPQHQTANTNNSIQPETAQAVHQFGGHTEVAAHETLFRRGVLRGDSTAHADNDLTDGQLHDTQTTSAEQNLAQGTNVNPASFNQYQNTPPSIYTQIETTQAHAPQHFSH
ncbi:hypothetical protein NpPPO83_00007381 [Neofusicoccum parvum]|uniref:Uncharacterized protein n=1 Tax=Neofusicoccum parvum TaxID=310453 RepID=A0ACB5S408_9PEZI|nr:hypothetical protein NpPPO83_00007381 [Neofusicoccum parvum]